MQWNSDRRAAWNKKHMFDAALDALRSQGLTQTQFSNLQGGMLPGKMKGMFLGMTPDMLKKIASFVDPQGTALPGTKTDPITGELIPGAMHFNYTDPRLQHGEAADEQALIPPWMQHQMGRGQGIDRGDGGGGYPIRHPIPFPGHDRGVHNGIPFRTAGGGFPPGLMRPFPGGQGPGSNRVYTGLGRLGYGNGSHGLHPGAPINFRGINFNGGGGGYPVRGPLRFQPPGMLPGRTPGGGGLRARMIAQALGRLG